jgi:hypothetical protein
VWLSGITRLSERQRREAVAARLTLDGSGREAGPQAKAKARFGAKQSRRPDALGASGHERVEARGCGALARTGAVPLQDLRAHVQRPHQNADGASAQEGTLADHALAMIEGKAWRKRPSFAAFIRPRLFVGVIGSLGAPAAHKPRMLRGIVEADETFRPRILQGPVVRSAAQGAQTRRNGQTSGPPPGQHPRSRRPRPERRDFRRGPASGRQLRSKPPSPASSSPAIISSATAGRRSPPSPAKPGFRSTPCRRLPPRRLATRY